MERNWDADCFDDALRCWNSGDGKDDTIRRARERQAVRYFWKSLGMRCPDSVGEAAAYRIAASPPHVAIRAERP